VNTGNVCFANAVLQLLVHSPPFWDLFRGLGDLTGQHGTGGSETGASVTPLVDATVKFSDEFVYREELSMTQQLQQKAAKGKAREDEEGKKEHNVVDSFNPRYLYDTMKEKRLLKDLLDGQQQDADEFFRLYLDALDEELLGLFASVSCHKSVTAAPGVEERVVSGLSGLADVGKRGFTVRRLIPNSLP
jgi:ubiquitin carboxyl-terminal hydrolase 10